MKDLLETDRQLRIVWKEFPILGPVSRFAARAAMASEKQDRYLEFHVAVMGSRGKLTEDRVMAIAGSVGLDVQRLRRDMEDPAIESISTKRSAWPKSSTSWDPAFVIGDTLVPGAVDGVRLKELIAKARSAAGARTDCVDLRAWQPPKVRTVTRTPKQRRAAQPANRSLGVVKSVLTSGYWCFRIMHC